MLGITFYRWRSGQRLITVLGLTLAVLVAGCQNPDPAAGVTPETATATAEIDNSMQALADVRRERDAMPGRAHYERVCASCHEGAVAKAPHREMISLMTPGAILTSLTGGIMQTQAATLSSSQRQEVAEYLGGTAMADTTNDIPACAASVQLDLSQPPALHNWGFTLDNKRHIRADQALLSRDQVTKLEPQWAFGFPAANRARSQPLLAGGLLFTGSHSGLVYAVDRASGCQVWEFQASAEVRTGLTIDPWSGPDADPVLYFGDVLGNVYGVNAKTGQLAWRDRADAHPNATITGTPSLHNGQLYVPVSALEVSNAIDPNYQCCTFRGSVVAYDVTQGQRLWQTYTIANEPSLQGQNAAGTDQFGPAGAVIWNSPAIDVRRNQLYVGTGENSASPASNTSDALIAMDLSSGKINWTYQATANDAWNTACDTDTPDNCPKENGPDFDFGAATVLVTTRTGQDLVLGGQKSGIVHALDPDNGEIVWQTRAGRGGIQGGVHFGMAADDTHVYVPITDMADGREYDEPDQPGVHALDLVTGDRVWYAPIKDECNGRQLCHPGVSQSISVIGDMVFAGGMDGILRVYASDSGELVHKMDTTGTYTSIDGGEAQGGSFGGAAGPVALNGQLVLTSGYGIYNHMPGNLLLVLAAPAK